MGRLFLIQYDRTPHTKFFLCRTCHTHIALGENLAFVYHLQNKGHFEKAVNLVIDGPEHYQRVGVNIEADALCNKCLGHLGFKYVEDDLHPDEPRIVLYTDKLLFWTGEQEVEGMSEIVHSLGLS